MEPSFENSEKFLLLLDSLAGLSKSTEKALRSNRNRERWYREAEHHYATLSDLLTDEELTSQLDKVLSKFSHTVNDPQSLDVAKSVLLDSDREKAFRQIELNHDRITRITSDGYQLLIEEARKTIKDARALTKMDGIPNSSLELKAVIEQTSGQFLLSKPPAPEPQFFTDETPNLALPVLPKKKRLKKKKIKLDLIERISKLTLGITGGIGNAILALPHYGLPHDVACASMTLSGTLFVRALAKFPTDFPNGIRRKPPKRDISPVDQTKPKSAKKSRKS